MKIKIKNTNKIIDLTMRDANGTNWVSDYIGNLGGIGNGIDWDADEEVYTASRETLQWWQQQISRHEKTLALLQVYYDKYNRHDIDEYLYMVSAWDVDPEHEHDSIKRALKNYDDDQG